MHPLAAYGLLVLPVKLTCFFTPGENNPSSAPRGRRLGGMRHG